jgi:uncharacterized protein (TIGR04255 family)
VFELPDPGRYRLRRPPLVLALVQIQFPIVGRIQELAGITPIQEGLRDVFPYMERLQVNQLTIGFGVGAPVQQPAQQTTVAWKFSDDAGWTAVFEPGSVSLSVGPTYTNVDDFRTRLERALRALHEAVNVPRCDRIGVRYVNVAQIVQGEAWTGWFRPQLAGWIASDIFTPETAVDSSISQTSLRGRGVGALAGAPYEVQAIIRHGLLPIGTTIPVASVMPLQPLTLPGFILDIDAFIAGPQPFDIDRLQQQFTGLHQQIDRFFVWSLAETGIDHFGMERQ